MKFIRQAMIGVVALSFASAVSTFAIEGLSMSVECPNAILSWPSTSNETYLVQFKTNLLDPIWITLTNYLPAAANTNRTVFVHLSVMDCSTNSSFIGGGSGGSPPMPSSFTAEDNSKPTPIWVLENRPPYPWDEGAISPAKHPATSLNGISLDGPTPMEAEDADLPEPTTGFYRVVRDGIHIFGLTNGMVLSGTAQFAIEIGVTNEDEIAGVTFFDDTGSPLVGATANTNGAGAWILEWDTTKAFNGDYTFYASLDFGGDESAVSTPIAVTVNNAISFPNYFAALYGGRMWIYAETIFPNSGYRIDMYDQNTNYLGYFSGTTDADGIISFLWGLSGRTDTNFHGVFTITNSSQNLMQTAFHNSSSRNEFQNSSPDFQELVSEVRFAQNDAAPNAGGSTSSASTSWAKEPSWSVGNSWAIAYSPLSPNDSVTTLRISEMMVGGDGGEYGGVVSTIGYYGLGAPMSPGNVSQSSAYEMADESSRTNFLGYMAQSQYRHFYFFGHGGPSSFGTRGVIINNRDIQRTLGNFMNSAKPALYHPYRFVFIDGCDAGKANLCETFGIPSVTVNTNYFATLKVESRAFLSFKAPISFDPPQWTWRALMLGGFFDDWMQGDTKLQTCVNNAVNAIHSSGHQPMPSSWVIYGANDLTKNTQTAVP